MPARMLGSYIGRLTDVVIEPEQSSTEFFKDISSWLGFILNQLADLCHPS